MKKFILLVLTVMLSAGVVMADKKCCKDKEKCTKTACAKKGEATTAKACCNKTAAKASCSETAAKTSTCNKGAATSSCCKNKATAAAATTKACAAGCQKACCAKVETAPADAHAGHKH